jgi:hypothetical protein
LRPEIGCSRVRGVAKEAATNKMRGLKIMAKEPKVDTTVKTQLASLTLDVNRLQKENQRLEEENKGLKRQNVQLASVIENDLKADLKLKIMAKSDYKQSDLEDLKVEQLQTIDETLSRSKGVDAVYKPIRAGTASQTEARMTVGSLYNKSRKEILEMGGEF